MIWANIAAMEYLKIHNFRRIVNIYRKVSSFIENVLKFLFCCHLLDKMKDSNYKKWSWLLSSLKKGGNNPNEHTRLLCGRINLIFAKTNDFNPTLFLHNS